MKAADQTASKPGEDSADGISEADVEEAIQACDGDARAAVRALLVANAHLDRENDGICKAASFGYRRGQVRGRLW
jgi:hypothetical protein